MSLPGQIKTNADICMAEAAKDNLFFGLLITVSLILIIIFAINLGQINTVKKGFIPFRTLSW